HRRGRQAVARAPAVRLRESLTGAPGQEVTAHGSTICTVGGVPFQVQKTEYVVPSSPPPSLKSTRIQASFVHTCIDQPGSGVAETSF
ncbi:hypothetical protein G3M53_12495, partial [Streptomyces sp. SID7982]|nr:hypothetical protein [Streptomyces sp. SID7982]